MCRLAWAPVNLHPFIWHPTDAGHFAFAHVIGKRKEQLGRPDYVVGLQHSMQKRLHSKAEPFLVWKFAL